MQCDLCKNRAYVDVQWGQVYVQTATFCNDHLSELTAKLNTALCIGSAWLRIDKPGTIKKIDTFPHNTYSYVTCVIDKDYPYKFEIESDLGETVVEGQDKLTYKISNQESRIEKFEEFYRKYRTSA